MSTLITFPSADEREKDFCETTSFQQVPPPLLRAFFTVGYFIQSLRAFRQADKLDSRPLVLLGRPLGLLGLPEGVLGGSRGALWRSGGGPWGALGGA